MRWWLPGDLRDPITITTIGDWNRDPPCPTKSSPPGIQAMELTLGLCQTSTWGEGTMGVPPIPMKPERLVFLFLLLLLIPISTKFYMVTGGYLGSITDTLPSTEVLGPLPGATSWSQAAPLPRELQAIACSSPVASGPVLCEGAIKGDPTQSVSI